MKKFSEYAIVFLLGGVSYSLIEVIFRGFTHWTMLLLGGTAFLMIYLTNIIFEGKPVFLKCAAGTLIITLSEFAAGCVINIAFKMNVWDYSSMKYNLLGQICPKYSIAWFFLCIPALFLCEKIRCGKLRDNKYPLKK